MKKDVVFACFTSYHIFTSCILANSTYKIHNKTILLSDILKNSDEIYERLKRLDIFNNVVIVKEEDFNRNTFNYDENYVLDQLKSQLKSTDTLHIFTWGCKYVHELYENFEFNKVILTDEGLSTYIFEYMPNWDNNHRRVDEIWLFDKRLYIGEKYKNIVKDIDVNCIISNKNSLYNLCKELNFIFAYDHKLAIGNLNIFFDQPFNKYGVLSKSEEILYLKNFNNIIPKLHYKTHPMDYNDKYINSKSKVLPIKKYIPWELVILNEISKCGTNNFTSVTYYSTAVFNSSLIFKKKNNIILLYKLLNYKNEFFEKLLEKYSIFYGDNNLFIPNSTEELKKKFKSNYEIENEYLIKNNNDISVFDEKFEEIDIEINRRITFRRIQIHSLRIRLNKLYKDYKYKKFNYLIWGASNSGEITKDVISKLLPQSNVIGFIDKFKEGQFLNKKIIKPQNITNEQFDYIFIATTPGRIEAVNYLEDIGLTEIDNFNYVIM